MANRKTMPLTSVNTRWIDLWSVRRCRDRGLTAKPPPRWLFGKPVRGGWARSMSFRPSDR